MQINWTYTLDKHVPLGYDYTAHSRRTILPELLITTRVYHQDHLTLTTLYLGHSIYMLKYEKHFQEMYRDVGMTVPKTTETRCRDGSVQGRHVIQRLHN